MTHIDDDCVYPLCPACYQRIERFERGVSYGHDIYHADCYKDKFGQEAALDESQQREHHRELDNRLLDRDERRERIRGWANFDERENGPHGARRVA